MAAWFVDDNDSGIRYLGAWETNIGDSNESGLTAHGTNATGGQAIFTFHGSSIAVYGTIRNEIDNNYSASTSISAYTVDNSSPTLYSGTFKDTILYNQLFYRSPDLGCGNGANHTLTVTFVPGSERKLWLDYFEVVGCRNMPSTATSDLAEPSTMPLSPQSLEKERNALLKILLGTAIGSSIIIIAILSYIFYRSRAKVRLFDPCPTARYPNALSRCPVIQRFKPRASTSPTITPFCDFRSGTTPLDAPQNMHTYLRNHTQSLYQPLIFGNNSRPLRRSYMQGGPLACKYERTNGRTVGSSDHRRCFMSMPNWIPRLPDPGRLEMETVDREAPPTYQAISSCMDQAL